MAIDSHDTIRATLESLKLRLQRIGYYVDGDKDEPDALPQEAQRGREETIQARLSKLQTRVNNLASSSPVARDLLHLRESNFEFLAQPATSNTPTTLATPEQLAVVNACATSFPATASRLNAIKDLPIPSAESSASLIALLPRLAKLELLQTAQSKELAELRNRTAAVMQRWYELGVLGEGECWTEWESRVVNVEKMVRRKEMQKTQENKEAEAYRS